MIISLTRNLKYILVILIMIIIIMFTLSQKKIHINEDIVLYKNGDADFMRTSTVKIEGTYYKKVFKENSFRGTITIENLIEPNGEMWDVEFSDGVGYIVYDNSNKGIGYFEVLGVIAIDSNFDEFYILLYDENDIGEYHMSYDAYPFICYPSANRIDSVLLIEKLSENNWYSNLKLK